jgi:hypothetical protein
MNVLTLIMAMIGKLLFFTEKLEKAAVHTPTGDKTRVVIELLSRTLTEVSERVTNARESGLDPLRANPLYLQPAMHCAAGC